MTLTKKYAKSKNKKWMVRFHTIHPDGDNYDGIVTNIKRNFIVIRETRELALDGIVVLPKKVLRGWRDSKFEASYNRILRYTGAIKKAKSPKWLEKCHSLSDVVRHLRMKNIWPMVEILFNKGRKKETDFFIGEIKEINDEGFWIRSYAATGKWEKEYPIEFKEIFKIEFDDPYSTIFNDYMRNS